MRPWGPISGATRVFGLIGHPVGQSLSPRMYNALFQKRGLDAVYLGFDVNPERSHQLANAIRALNLGGVNLTAPFKEVILDQLDRLTIAAEEAGAVNVVAQVGGRLTGFNTDGLGLVQSLQESLDWRPRGQRCLVLGAGGAGRAVAAALGAGEAQVVHLLNRTADRASRACSHLKMMLPRVGYEAAPLSLDSFSRLAGEVDIIINCLGSGAEEIVAQFPISFLQPETIWADINYWMPRPPGLEACARRGLRTDNGLGMLLHQGALSFEIFTGYPVSPEDLRRAVVDPSLFG